MPGGVDQVYEEAGAVLVLFDEGQVILLELIVQGDRTARGGGGGRRHNDMKTAYQSGVEKAVV